MKAPASRRPHVDRAASPGRHRHGDPSPHSPGEGATCSEDTEGACPPDFRVSRSRATVAVRDRDATQVGLGDSGCGRSGGLRRTLCPPAQRAEGGDAETEQRQGARLRNRI